MALQVFTRATTFPDLANLYPAVIAVIGNQFLLFCDSKDDGTKPVLIDKSTPWQAAEITAVQTAVTNAPASPALLFSSDSFPLPLKAIVLALIDQLNVIRANLPTPLGAITPVQALAAIRTKAGSL